jgi:hypothetical protein
VKNAPAFVFDWIEPERPKVDRAEVGFVKSEALHPDIHFKFSVVDSTSNPPKEETEDVTMARWPTLPPEARLVNPAQVGGPDNESTDYLIVSTRLNTAAAGIPFNALPNRQTRDFFISGKTVVLQAGHPNGLYERLNFVAASDPTKDSGQPNADIRLVSIQSETVVIGTALRIPRANWLFTPGT